MLNNHFEGLCYALENAARMLTMTEKEDIGVIPSGNAAGEQTDGKDQVLVYIYDKFTGVWAMRKKPMSGCRRLSAGPGRWWPGAAVRMAVLPVSETTG